ncbi:TetR/AcrR family transcriptional regulator [Embleya sp. NPDC001921]
MGRTSTARTRLLEAGCALMHARGYSAIGVAEICARADVRKGSFYHFFDSKQALTLEVIDAHWHEQRADWTALLGADAPPLERLRSLFDAMQELQRRTRDESGSVNGCLLGNLALELGNQEPAVRARLEEVFAEQIALIHAVLVEAVAIGAVPAAAGDGRTARAVVAQVEGMVLFAKLANDPAVLDDLWPHTLLLLGCAHDVAATEPAAS